MDLGKTSLIRMGDLLAVVSDSPMWPHPANIFLIRDEEGVSLIDVGCGGQSGPEKLKMGLHGLGMDWQSIHTIALTHAHPDHMGLMGLILEECSPGVFIHEVEAQYAQNPELLYHTFDVELARIRCSDPENPSPYARFDLLSYFHSSGCDMCEIRTMEKLKGGQSIKLGAKSWQAIDTPGHSPGHISLFEPESRTIVSGDLVGDIPAWHTPNSGGLDAYLKSLDKLESLEGEIILPSHGKPGLDAQASIRRIRTKLLERQETILDLLKNGPLSFARINRELFKTEPLQFFPGSVILESHLIKLELENRISRFFEDESGFGERIIVARA